jgi:hypothetical protein
MASGSARIKVTGIFPKRFKKDAFETEFLKAAEETSRATVKEFKKTHQTWQEQRPTWRRDVQSKFSGIVWQVDTSHLIYYFLNNGTDVRYAAMTPGFKPKTRPGFIGSTPGFGGFSHLNTRNPPGPNGIEGRFWDKAIKKKMEPIVVKRYEKAMKAGAQKSGHSYG